MPTYEAIASAVEPTGMMARGAFAHTDDDGNDHHVVMIGNAGTAMWPGFQRWLRSQPDPDSLADPLDTWTRITLEPIAARFGAAFVHPSDEPFQPFQRWAQLSDVVSPSPIGLLIHPGYGLWHAYRGAFVSDVPITGVSPVSDQVSPCVACDGRPCLSACPVDAFSPVSYDVDACAGHLRSGSEPTCRSIGCRARAACPIGVDFTYREAQMRFHMDAFAAAHGVE